MGQYKIEGTDEVGRCVFRATGIQSGETADSLLQIAMPANPKATSWEVTGVDVAFGCQVEAAEPLVVPRLELPPVGWTLVALEGTPDTGIDPLQRLCLRTFGSAGRTVWFNAIGDPCGVKLGADTDSTRVDAAFAWLAFEILRRRLQP
jgi:hypothetical protein